MHYTNLYHYFVYVEDGDKEMRKEVTVIFMLDWTCFEACHGPTPVPIALPLCLTLFLFFTRQGQQSHREGGRAIVVTDKQQLLEIYE
jgi:hypothetical protein